MLNHTTNNTLIAISTLLLSATLFAGTPVVKAVYSVQKPTHLVEKKFGWSNYEGSVEANTQYLIACAQYDEQTELISGKITIYDRITLTELGTLRPETPTDQSGWGRLVALSENYLAVQTGYDSGTVDVYDLSEEGCPRVYTMTGNHNLLSMKSLQINEPIWVFSTSTRTCTYRVCDGQYLHDWDVPMGELSTANGGQLFSHTDNPSWGAPDEYTLANLSQNQSVINLREFPGIDPNYTEFYAWQQENLILIFANRFYAIDPVAESILWESDLSVADWYNPTVLNGRIFVDALSDYVDVFDLQTGAHLKTITCPFQTTSWFGFNISSAYGLLFLDAGNRLLAYDEATLEYLYEIDLQGHAALRTGTARPIPNSEDILFLYNLNNFSNPLYNRHYRNPQGMLFDVSAQRFTHQIDLNQAIIVGWEMETNPANLPISILGAGAGRIGILSKSSSHDNPYQVFDPSLFAGEQDHRIVSSIEFTEIPGCAYELQRHADGISESLLQVEFGTGETHVYDLPKNESNASYSLHEEEIVFITDNYETALSDVGSLLNHTVTGNYPSRHFALSPNATTLAASTVTQSGYPIVNYNGQVSILDVFTGSERFVLSSNPSQAGQGFGNDLALSESHLAVGDANRSAVSVYDAQHGELVNLFGKYAGFTLASNSLFRVVKTTSGSHMLVCNDLVSGEQHYSVPVAYNPSFDWMKPDVHASDDYVVVELDVFDLATGTYQHTLSSPNPETNDYFGTRVACDGNQFVAISAKQATGYLFDLENGECTQTFSLPEWPNGYDNFASDQPTLALDTESGVFAWGTPSLRANSAIHLFNIHTGERIAKIISPQTEMILTDFWSGEETVFKNPTDSIGYGMAITSESLYFAASNISSNYCIRKQDIASLRNHTPVDHSRTLTPSPSIEITIQTRSDLIYKPLCGSDLTALESLDELSFSGTGKEKTQRFPIPDHARTWFGGLRVQWVNPTGTF